MLQHPTQPKLLFVIPCYNEESVLPVTAPLFLQKCESLISSGLISPESGILFVNDGSSDGTWGIISRLHSQHSCICGISLSRNRGHQNALLAGLFEAAGNCDITVSMDCDGQDDINAVDEMLLRYREGAEIVYGVRSRRDTDSFGKRFTARAFYKLLSGMGVETVYDHADYRLMSARALQELEKFREVNLYLRGMVPLLGFPVAYVQYERHERMAGSSHYPLRKMLALAVNGITGFSVKPLELIFFLGLIVLFGSLCWLIAALCSGNDSGIGHALIALLSSVQLTAIGVLGTYLGKIYLEVKARPRYIISERT